jgi:hypothetical protein
MRSITFVLTAIVASGLAAAQSWQEYTYPDYAFAVAFPADPQIETTTYQAANGRPVPAQVYSVRQDNFVFKMTVADHAGTGLEESAVIDHAIKTLSAGGEVKVNIPHRIYRVYGRQLSIVGADGSHSTAAMFDYKGRLYQIEGKALAGGSGSQFETTRFQQSLTFTDGGANRSEDAIRAIREACRGSGAGEDGGPPNPAGLDDPRCRRGAPQ